MHESSSTQSLSTSRRMVVMASSEALWVRSHQCEALTCSGATFLHFTAHSMVLSLVLTHLR